MMKLKCIALSMACVMVMALTGCSANRDNGTASAQPSSSVSSDHNDRASDRVDDIRNSAGVDDARNSANVGNDAAQGGGAGGTNDTNNDGKPDGGTGNNVVDDIGDAAGDLVQGAGDAVKDAGDAVGNAARDIGGAMR